MDEIKEKSQKCKKNVVIEFFWFCSGANIDILRCCPTDHSRYFGIGGTILFTALMASFAGGYAFFTAFHNTILSIFFGIFWGLMIFNLDRYIVITIGKGDGTAKITKDEFLSALPRILMAILIGFVIATPLELKLFEKEINVEIESLIQGETAKLQNADSSIIYDLTELKKEKINLENRNHDIDEGKSPDIIDQQIKLLQDKIPPIQQTKVAPGNAISNLSVQINKLRNTLNNIISNQNNQSQINTIDRQINDINYKIGINRSIISKADRDLIEIQKNIDLLENKKINGLTDERDNNKNKIQELSNRIKDKQKRLDDRNIVYAGVTSQYNGFMARIEAYERLQKKHFSLRIVGIFITLLLVFVEIAPVFFKMMTESGPYDDIYERVKHEVNVREKQKISNINDIINSDIEINTKKNQNRLNAEIKANEELLNAIALAQAEIAKKAINKWKEKEIKKAEENPESIIQSNTNNS